MRDAWDIAQLALLLLQVDPVGIGGVWLQSGFGPVRQTWLEQLQKLKLNLHRMPHHIDHESLLGGIDLSITLAQGRIVEQIGLLAKADQGLVVIAMSEKLSAQTLAMLLQAQDQGEIHALEIGATHPSRFGIVALDESLDDEPGVASKLKERLALWINIDSVSHFQCQEKIDPLSSSDLIQARELLTQITPTQEQLEALCEVTLALGIDSLRAPLLALRVACIHAAIHERTKLIEEDLSLATQLVLSPRATRLPASSEEQTNPEVEQPSTEEVPPSPAPPVENNEDKENNKKEEEPSPHTDPESLEDTILAAAMASLPPQLLDQLLLGSSQKKSAANSGNNGQSYMSRQRGRPLSPRLGRPSAGARLHLLATLRAAAPKQKLRQKHAGQKIAIRTEDFFVQRFAQRASSCIIIAMDASGSAALARLAEAKGAVEILLQQSYCRRDSVCVIAFRGSQAQTLLPPTRSLVRAKKALAGLPGGGGTPIALALKHASEQAQALQRQGISPLLVMLSDGKANVTIEGLGGRTQAQADALQWAKHWATQGFASLWIDTAPQPTGQAQELANTMQGRYLPMPYMASQRLADAVQTAIES